MQIINACRNCKGPLVVVIVVVVAAVVLKPTLGKCCELPEAPKGMAKRRWLQRRVGGVSCPRPLLREGLLNSRSDRDVVVNRRSKRFGFAGRRLFLARALANWFSSLALAVLHVLPIARARNWSFPCGSVVSPLGLGRKPGLPSMTFHGHRPCFRLRRPASMPRMPRMPHAACRLGPGL